MQEKVSGVVLNVIKYNDRHNIAHVYTDRFGVLPVLVRQGSTPAARARNAMFAPLSLVEMVAVTRAGQDLAHVRDVKRTALMLDLHTNPVKRAMALFLSEVVAKAVVEQERNEPLYLFLTQSIRRLNDCRQGVANFHLCFLYRLGRFVGIQPDVATYAEGRRFDMDDGTFTAGITPGHRTLPPEHARAIYLLSRMTYDNMHRFRFTQDQRRLFLELILDYYRLHQSTLGSLRSLDVLKQLFF